MSEARTNMNQASANGGAAAAVPIGVVAATGASAEVVSEAVAGGGPDAFPQIVPGQSMRVPENEAEAEAMMRAQFNDDPDLMRRAGQEFLARMNRLAERAAAERTGAPAAEQATIPAAVVEVTAEHVTSPTVVEHVPDADSPQVAAPSPQSAAPPQPAPTPQSAASSPAPQQIDFPPPGYLPVPEGLFTWTPETWGGRPLHCVLDHAVERDRQATVLILILVAPAYARNRAGRVVSLPQGARVAVHAGIAWRPVIPLAKGPEGRPVICARPSLDPHGRPLVYDLGDGAREWGLEIVFDPDPKNPGFPRLINLETVRGTRPVGGE